jgi:hypothetical protein
LGLHRNEGKLRKKFSDEPDAELADAEVSDDAGLTGAEKSGTKTKFTT